MNLHNNPHKTSDELAQNYSRRTLKGISEQNENIRKAYNKEALFQKLPLKDRVDTYAKSFKLNANFIMAVTGGSTATGLVVGGIVGAIVGSTTVNPVGLVGCTVAGVATGGTIGLATGISVCAYHGKFLDTKTLEFTVKNRDDYQTYKDMMTEKQYKLLTQFVKDYIEFMKPEEVHELDEYLCCISYMLPECPVFSPHDIGMRHVYEKSVIEEHLKSIEIDLVAASDRGENVARLIEIFKKTDPFRGPGFVRADLVYHPAYAKHVVKALLAIQKRMETETPDNKDPVLVKAIDHLVAHYERTYTESTKATINLLVKDMLKLGAEYEDAMQIAKEFKKSFKSVK